MNPNHDDHGRFEAGGGSSGGGAAAHERVPSRVRYAPNHPGSNAYQHEYNQQGVQRAIESARRVSHVSGREARMIHAILRGRG